MVDSYQTLLTEITAQSPVIAQSYARIVDYWHPDSPPETTALAGIAQNIVDNYQNIGKSEITKVMQIVEAAISSNDGHIVMVFATGFIEALASKTYRERDVWLELRSMMGAHSRRFAENWINPSLS